MSPRVLLSRHPLIRTTDFDEAVTAQQSVTCAVEAELNDRATPFEWHANRAVVGPIALTSSWYRAGVTARADAPDDIVTVLLARRGQAEGRQGGASVEVVRGRTGFVQSALGPVEITMRSGIETLNIMIRQSSLSAALDALTGEQGDAPLRFDPSMRLNTSVGRSWMRTLRFVVSELEEESTILRSPLVLAGLGDALLYGLLTGQRHSRTGSVEKPVRAASTVHVRRMEEYLEANAGAPVRLSDLVALVGVSARSIQQGFRAHHGCSPMQFLRARRLELARARLSERPAAPVTEVALACGFTHLGRFSVEYRRRFGESPSTTRSR